MPEIREVIDIESECSDAKAPEGYSRSNWFSSENWDEPVSQQGPEPYDYDVFTDNTSAAGEPEGRMEDEGL